MADGIILVLASSPVASIVITITITIIIISTM
jgi:hypothetical protein